MIVDYVNAFGTKVVRAISGGDSAVVGSEIWLPDWLTPTDVDFPVTIENTDPARLSAVTAFAPGSEFRSALAVAVPGITGISGLIIALTEQGTGFDETQTEAAKTIAAVLSLSASRSNADGIVQRDEALLVATHHISRLGGDAADDYPAMLTKLVTQLRQFFEIDVIALRAQIDGTFITYGLVSVGTDRTFEISDSGFDSVESRAASRRVAVSNTTFDSESAALSNQYPAWKSAGIESTLAIPVNASSSQILVLGSTRIEAYPSNSVATANKFMPALTAAFANDLPISLQPQSDGGTGPAKTDYLASIAAVTELIPACGVIAAQITKRTGAVRVQVGFLEEKSGRTQLRFDTDKSGDVLDSAWINTADVELLVESDPDTQESSIRRFSQVRVPLKIADRIFGFVEATAGDAGFDESDVAQVKQISAVCAPVVVNLKQLEQSRNTLEKLEMLNRVCDQIRRDSSGAPLNNPRIASLVRNMFKADWLYFGNIDHENDHVTTQFTDGLDVPELKIGAQVSRRSLLIPSGTESAPAGPATVDIESAAPGQRAAGRWMYRAGLRSAVAAPLQIGGVITAMFIGASNTPTGFGSLEKKMAGRLAAEMMDSIAKARSAADSSSKSGISKKTISNSGDLLPAILTNASVLVLTIAKNGVVKKVEGHGFEGSRITPKRLLGRNIVKYSRLINGFSEPFSRALSGDSGRLQIEFFGTVIDVQLEPIKSKNGTVNTVTVVIVDITDKINAEHFEVEAKFLREEKQRTGEFVGHLTHEMRNTLQLVTTISEILGADGRGNLHPDQIKDIRLVERNADRLNGLVEAFLNISAMEAGTFDLKQSKFPIAEFAREIEGSFEPIAKHKDQILTVTTPEEDRV
ncbi:MAG: HAMP domain-containing histidine kinase, partial [Rhodopirellula sp.]|nr:HAMP domain-containing histidine kinase [Rhodopirellula sp.]